MFRPHFRIFTIAHKNDRVFKRPKSLTILNDHDDHVPLYYCEGLARTWSGGGVPREALLMMIPPFLEVFSTINAWRGEMKLWKSIIQLRLKS